MPASGGSGQGGGGCTSCCGGFSKVFADLLQNAEGQKRSTTDKEDKDEALPQKLNTRKVAFNLPDDDDDDDDDEDEGQERDFKMGQSEVLNGIATWNLIATQALKRSAPGAPSISRDQRKRRLKSRVVRRADNATSPKDAESKTPSNLRILKDELVEDRYILGEAAGEGISGVVRIVTDQRTRTQRVLKSLRFSSAGSHDQFEELLNEMEVYLKLDHPNICKLLEVYVEEDAIHLIMELCHGRELFERWDGKGVYSEADASVAVAQMTDAITYMHTNNIVHRDLKLENWVYADTTENARLKLIDFGFSKVVSPDSTMTGVLGTVYYIAPEILRGSYDSKCDVWSTGVVTYMLLTGFPPFGEYDDADQHIMSKIKRGVPFKTKIPEWQSISADGKDFVSMLLTVDPSHRPTMRQAAEHRWLKHHKHSRTGGPAAQVDSKILENMRSFAGCNVIKRAAFCLIAYSMSVDETDSLEAQFKKLDKQGNGTVTMQELCDALKEHLDMPEDQAKLLFQKLDLTGDKKLNYSEFLAAACQRRFMAQEDHIQEAFRRFDVDKTGFITLDNLRSVLGDEYNGTRVEDILAQVDIQGNGVISYEAFVKALMDLGTSDDQGQRDEDLKTMKKISRAIEFTSVGSKVENRYRRSTSSQGGRYQTASGRFRVNSDPVGLQEEEQPKTRPTRSKSDFGNMAHGGPEDGEEGSRSNVATGSRRWQKHSNASAVDIGEVSVPESESSFAATAPAATRPAAEKPKTTTTTTTTTSEPAPPVARSKTPVANVGGKVVYG